ncbi:hypothetical protein BV20DRAFT_936964 [Pilatotrama ljubarskyi]|nr:hypothetical protein BV20DRAFT_936964 [Pilatotrama ljubarskyi]
MALTATAQSALPREPAWDEVIVPALRKRLKDESNALAKRISAASITSSEDHPGQYYATSPIPSSSQSRPSAIPRPSLQQSRTADLYSTKQAGAHSPPYQRARALSQPYPFDPANPADLPPSPPSDYSRSISPANVPKGTRIPVSRRRTGSTSSQAHSTYSASAGRTNGRPNGEASDGPPLSPVEERMQSHTSRSTVRVPRHKVSDIFNEQAPFVPNSLSSSQSNFDVGRQSPDRMSTDSEEHPFEHWYRGDVARNGGVGELRVARRQEMLDIANYGHTLRKASGKHTPGGTSARSRSSSRGREMANGRSHARSRAGSVGARESIYIDQEEAVAEAGMVLDERPLTDLEDEGYGDQDEEYYTDPVQPHPNGSISSPSLDRSDTPTSRYTQNTARSRIPQPATRPSASPKTGTPTKPTRSASETGASTSSAPASSPKMSRTTSQQKAQSPSSATSQAQQTPTAKRRAKSPATAASASAAKKAKAKSPPSSMQKRPTQKEENRRSIGQYPMPEGDEDAIPTWTQPVPANGNWDDVVIPVVARKKGLDGLYQTADGSPKPKEPEPVVYEPAPGTFGYDATKYRRRQSGNPEQIQMDEFGQRATRPEQELSVPNNEHTVTSQAPSPIPPLTPAAFDRSNRAPSPPPFAHYAQSENGQRCTPQTMQVTANPQPSGKEQHVVEEESGGGCCKCVIM